MKSNQRATIETLLERNTPQREIARKTVKAPAMNAAAIDSKRLATVKARCALAGITLHELDGDFGTPIFVATRWALTRQFDSLDQVEDWLVIVTGTSA